MSSEVKQNNPRLRTEYQEVVVKKLMDDRLKMGGGIPFLATR